MYMGNSFLKMEINILQMAEQISDEEMKISKFQPIAIKHFIVYLDGVDSFLFHSFERPEWKKDGWLDKILRVFGKDDRRLIGVMHNPIAPSGEQQLREWMMSQSFSGRKELKKRILKYSKDKERDMESDYYKQCMKKERTLVLKYLDPVGTVVSEVRYEGVTIDKVTFSELDYLNYEYCKIRFEMKFRKEVFEF